MGAPANKRRKTEHTASDEEADTASFASFSGFDDASENAEPSDHEQNGLDAGDASESDSEEELEDVQERFIDVDHRVFAKKAQSHLRQTFPRRDVHKPNTTHENGAYLSGTFKSNMFKIWTDDLLEQIRPKHTKREVAIEAALKKLQASIENLRAREPLPVEEAERQLLMSSKTVIPFPEPRPPKDAKYQLAYVRPSSIHVVGSYPLQIRSRANATVEVDMSVMMPKALFEDKDYLNYRYFYKRAYYIACIAAGLKDAHANDFRFYFRNLYDNELQPVLVISPLEQRNEGSKNKSTARWEINIIPSVHAGVFADKKLRPDQNCVRASSPSSNGNGAASKEIPTPFYNASILSDTLVNSYHAVLLRASKNCPAFQDACLLGNTWLRQRGLGSSIEVGGFGNFELSALMALLLEGGGSSGRPILGERYSSYQIFKATLQLLATRDLIKETFAVSEGNDASTPKAAGSPILWDGIRHHNLFFKMTPWSYKMLRSEARTTLNVLSDQSVDGFEATFILQVDSPLYRYDYVLEMPLSAIQGRSHQNGRSSGEYHELYSIFARALGDRVSLINIRPARHEDRRVDFARPRRDARGTIRVGFVVNPDNVNRTVDHGPPAGNKTETASFRTFWGEKAELRRFKDGSILESLVWSAKDPQSVFEQILRHVVKLHLDDDAERDLTLTGDGFQRLLSRAPLEGGFASLMESFKQLEVDIRGLDDLPLSIRQIVPADAQLRYASASLPNGAKQEAPADVIIQFEGSARWPDDLTAIQRTKIAFLLKLSGLLQEAVDNITVRIGLENEEHDILNQGFLDINYGTGAAFRLRIHHDREQTLLERRLKDKTSDPRSKEVAALGLATYKRDYTKTPAFTQAIARLCNRFPPMSGTIRLLKKWFACHLLANHIAEEIIELLAARTFLQPWPWQTPTSVQTGFLRTLSWLSRWDWRNEPLVVDLSGNDEFKQADIQNINSKFEAWRNLDPMLNRVVLFCASSVDVHGTTWTDGRPQKVVATRMTALAKAACAGVKEKELELEPASLFSSPLSDFDFVIHLKDHFIPGKARPKRPSINGSTFKNLELDINDDESSSAHQPVLSLLGELEQLFGVSVLFFSGGRERAVIAGLWNPQTAPRAWKLNLAYSTIPKMQNGQEEVQAEVNKGAVLSEIARLGGDMIEKIEVNQK